MYQFKWNYIIPNLPYILHGMQITMEITITTIIVGIILGTILAIIHLSPINFISWFARIYIHIFRSIPLIMILLWFYLIIPNFLQNIFNSFFKIDIRLISAIITFSLFEAAYYAEIIRAGILSVPNTQSLAAVALGMTYRQVMQFVILPQALKTMIPLLLSQGIILFQDTSLVYVLSLADFFHTVSIIGERDGTQIEMILFAGLVYFSISVTTSILVNYIKNKRG